jgi:hypothetical protein
MASDNKLSTYSQRHFSVSELASTWNLSEDTIRRLFLTEPGVLVIHRPRRRARTYKTLRIPATVAEQVYKRLVCGGPYER